MKRQSVEWEKIVADHVSVMGLISKIYKEFLQLNSKKKKKSNLKWAKDLNKYFSTDNIQMTNKYMKRCSASRSWGKFKFQPQWDIISYLLEFGGSLVNKSCLLFAIIKKKDNKCWQECRDIGCYCMLLVEIKNGATIWKTIWSFLNKLNTELPYDPAIPLLGIYPKELK